MILMKITEHGGVRVFSYDAGYGVYKNYAEIDTKSEDCPSEILMRFFRDILCDMKNKGGTIKMYVDRRIKNVDLDDIKVFLREIKSDALDCMLFYYFSTGNWQAPDQGEYDLPDLIHEILRERGLEPINNV